MNAPSEEETSHPDNPPSSDLVQSRGAVLAALFLVTGIFGLPLLWMNQRFSPSERILWAVVVSIYSLAMVVFGLWFLWWMYKVLFGV